MDFTSEDGTELCVATAAELRPALERLGRHGNQFAILARAPDVFIQAVMTAPGAFALEYRDGPAATHARSRREDFTRADVSRFFASYLQQNSEWRVAVNWRNLGLREFRGHHKGRVSDTGAAVMLVVLGVAIVAGAAFAKGAASKGFALAGTAIVVGGVSAFRRARREKTHREVTYSPPRE